MLGEFAHTAGCKVDAEPAIVQFLDLLRSVKSPPSCATDRGGRDAKHNLLPAFKPRNSPSARRQCATVYTLGGIGSEYTLSGINLSYALEGINSFYPLRGINYSYTLEGILCSYPFRV